MKVKDVNKLTVGAPVAFLDTVALIYFNGSVSAITPNKNLTVATPGGANYPKPPLRPGAVTKPTSHSFVLDKALDGDVELPLTALI
jgi:hypothetical protein